MKARRTLRIERLVLHGVPPGERTRIAAALQTELQRLLGAADLAAASRPAGGEGARDLRPGAAPEAIGKQAARQLFERVAVSAPGAPAARSRRGGGA
jgi:hypothetical protein